MSIDATVWDVTRDREPLEDDDSGELRIKLWLKPREESGVAGQSRLIVVNECDVAEWLVGYNIWAAGSGPIMIDDFQIGKRIGYVRCELDRQAIAIATNDGGLYQEPLEA